MLVNRLMIPNMLTVHAKIEADPLQITNAERPLNLIIHVPNVAFIRILTLKCVLITSGHEETCSSGVQSSKKSSFILDGCIGMLIAVNKSIVKLGAYTSQHRSQPPQGLCICPLNISDDGNLRRE